MNKTLAAACLFAFCAFTQISWAKSLPLEAPDPGKGTIGVTVKVIPPAKMGSNYANLVFFVRVVDDADRFGADSLIPSTYSRGQHVYLLNAKPGRYVAVGCKFDMGRVGVPLGGVSGEGAAVFAQADILRTEVEVRAGAVAFMGDIVTGSSTKIKEADPAQAHYLRMISPRGAEQAFMARAFTGHIIYTAAFKSVERGEAAEREFCVAAIPNFKDEPAWSRRIAARSASLFATAVRPAATGEKISAGDFLSTVCVAANTAKGRVTGLGEDAESVARTICLRVASDWSSHGCDGNPGQEPCKKILGRMDSDLKGAGSSMLFAAAQAGVVSICSVMIASGSDPNAPIATSWTPLMAAAEQGHDDVVRALVAAGAHLDARNAAGATALEIATAAGKQPVADTLREAGNKKADPTQLEDARMAMTAQDYETALRLLPPLAEGGDAAAQNMLGVLYLQGWGAAQDRGAALSWFRKSADLGDPKGAYNLGRMYDNGWGVTKDLGEAAKWYRISADKNYALGQSILGALYATGEGVPQDYAEAMKWYRLAADQGEAEAQRRLGLMYAEGQGVPKDDVQALSWYRKAAEQGNIGGQYWVGRCYLEGRGVGQNDALAREWLGKAAAQGSAEAQQLLASVPSSKP